MSRPALKAACKWALCWTQCTCPAPAHVGRVRDAVAWLLASQGSSLLRHVGLWTRWTSRCVQWWHKAGSPPGRETWAWEQPGMTDRGFLRPQV